MNVQDLKPFQSIEPGKKRSKKAKPEKLSRKEYERELQKLQVELCHLQDWVRDAGARVIIVFEGRDTAGKGGLIKRLVERVSPAPFASLP
jgi:polyphosphate kinase 2 (PPK2 family)